MWFKFGFKKVYFTQYPFQQCSVVRCHETGRSESSRLAYFQKAAPFLQELNTMNTQAVMTSVFLILFDLKMLISN
jgi:hypothetical protein